MYLNKPKSIAIQMPEKINTRCWISWKNTGIRGLKFWRSILKVVPTLLLLTTFLGTEFKILDQLLSVHICQILMEIHGDIAQRNLDLIRKLAQNGFYLFAFQVNGNHPAYGEYGFIHESCFSSYGIDAVYGRYLVWFAVYLTLVLYKIFIRKMRHNLTLLNLQNLF